MASVLSPDIRPGRVCREGRTGGPRLSPLQPGCWVPPATHLPWLLCRQPLQPGPGVPRDQDPPVRREAQLSVVCVGEEVEMGAINCLERTPGCGG